MQRKKDGKDRKQSTKIHSDCFHCHDEVRIVVMFTVIIKSLIMADCFTRWIFSETGVSCSSRIHPPAGSFY